MKLNNRGWGTVEMISLSIALLFALLISVFFIYKFYSSFGKSVTSGKFSMNLETKLEDSAKKFVLDYDIDVIDDYKVSYELLKNNGYINDLVDSNGNACDGYVLVTNIDSINYYKAYISCNE